jgi:hypothetical protein
MFRKYTLQPAIWHRKPLEFEWDAESGQVRGPDSSTVLHLVSIAVKNGGLTGHPYPTEFTITDPLHNISEMAVVFGNDWLLSPDLAKAYPSAPQDDDLPVMVDDKGVEVSLSDHILH